MRGRAQDVFGRFEVTSEVQQRLRHLQAVAPREAHVQYDRVVVVHRRLVSEIKFVLVSKDGR